MDCTKFTYDTPPDQAILDAVELTIMRLNQTEGNAEATIDRAYNLDRSLLESIDVIHATQAQITEAFCRDVDTLSFEFQSSSSRGYLGGGGAIGVGGSRGVPP